ncbi:unnamed protein product, partial [Mesorhabditis spiculigera]
MAVEGTQEGSKRKDGGKAAGRRRTANKREKLKPGMIIESQVTKYEIIELLGSGGFGDTYAIKTECHAEHINKRMLRLKMECEVLKVASQIPDPKKKLHFVPFYDSGRSDDIRFMVMGLVGPSIYELRKKLPDEKFSKASAWRISIEALDGIADLHDLGYIHRDIKPANFAIGLEDKQHTIYLLDFGIARKYLQADGQHKPPREKAKFVGTVGFASRGCHQSVEQSRKDDLETWCYMVIDLCAHKLIPWRCSATKEDVYALKCELFQFDQKHHKIWDTVPKDFRRMMKYVDELTYYQAPDYKMMQMHMDKIAKDEGIKIGNKPEWISKKSHDRKKKTAEQKSSPSEDDVEDSEESTDSDRRKKKKKKKLTKESGSGKKDQKNGSGKKRHDKKKK